MAATTGSERARGSQGRRGVRLADVGEADVLAAILPLFERGPGARGPGVLVPAGDDAAVLDARGSTVATTDSMVRGVDWRDDWSTARDVGAKIVAQNLADIAAMGALPRALLVALAVDPGTELAWVVDLAGGIADAAHAAEASVAGGDLSSAPPGVLVVSVTALGDLRGAAPVLRSGARVGDVVAVCGSLGRSGGGLTLLRDGRAPGAEEAGPEAAAAKALVQHHRAPVTPWRAGPQAGGAGATSMIDVSDGLIRDASRVAAASGVEIALSGPRLSEYAAGPLGALLGAEGAWREVLSGGEEHSLLATFPPGSALIGAGSEHAEGAGPRGANAEAEQWRVIGEVTQAGDAGPRVTVDGDVPDASGWDHFAG